MASGGLRRSLISAIVTAIGALVLVLLLLEDPLVQFRLRTIVQDLLGDAIVEVVDEHAESGDWQGATQSAAATNGVRVSVIQDGRTIADSAGTLEESIERDAYETFLAGGTDHVHRADLHLRFERIDAETIIQAQMPTHVTSRIRQSVRELVIVSGIMAGLVALFLTLVLSRTLIEPAQDLTRVAGALASGDLSARTRSEREDELGEIGRGLDRMADQLEDRINTLRGEQNRLRTVLNAMVEAVFVADPLGRIRQTNAAFDRLVQDDVVGRTAEEVLGSHQLHEAVRAARRRNSAKVELPFERDGEEHHLSAEIAPLPDETGVVVVLHDVTTLQRADRIRRDFVANASHELRTPLTAIRGFAETLKDGAIHDPVAAERFIDVILRHTHRLDALVSDLAALSRAESPSQALEMEPVDVQAAIGEVLQGLTAKADERSVQLIMRPASGDVRAWASQRGLDQVLVNLVDNALKYTPEGSSVHVEASREEDGVRISVHNPGPGIPAKHHSRLFERFYRVDEGRSREVGGTGLGLAIVKHLCTQMSATVAVKSAPGQGSTFTVLLRPLDEHDSLVDGERGTSLPG